MKETNKKINPKHSQYHYVKHSYTYLFKSLFNNEVWINVAIDNNYMVYGIYLHTNCSK